MESDRGAVLTVRSAVRNVIDYSEADLFDKSWWRRWRVLVTGMSNLDTIEVLKPLFEYQLSLVANSGLTDDSFKRAQEQAKENFEDIVGAMRPWEGRTKEGRLQTMEEEFKKDWQAIFGWDIDDKEKLAKYWEDRKADEIRHSEEQEKEIAAEAAEKQKRIDLQERLRQRRALANRR